MFCDGCTVFDQGELVKNLSICFGVQSAGFLSFQASDAQAMLTSAMAAAIQMIELFTVDFIFDPPAKTDVEFPIQEPGIIPQSRTSTALFAASVPGFRV